jgi:hypothetical protein
MEVQVARNGKYALEPVVDKIKLETQEENQCIDKLEKKRMKVFTRIPYNADEATTNV